MDFRMLVLSGVFVLAVTNRSALAATVTCVPSQNGVIVCSNGTTITQAQNGVYVSSDGTTITQAQNGVYVGSDGTTVTQAQNGVYVSSDGTAYVSGPSNSAPNPVPAQILCTYNLMVDSVLAKAYDAFAENFEEACRNARNICEAGIQKNKDNLSDYELACYVKGDKNNPVNKYLSAWVMCGDSSGSYRECSLLGEKSRVHIQKAYSTTFGSFKDYDSYYDYYVAHGGPKWDVVAYKRQMVEQCGLQDEKWGITDDSERLWVKDGCSGAFRVFYSKIDGQQPSEAGRKCTQVKLDVCLKNGGGNACYAKWCI